MPTYRVGGYHGPVTVLTQDDVAVAQAACRSSAEKDYDGVRSWSGKLREVTPFGAIGAGVYRLHFPTGEHGDVRVRAPLPDSEFVYFEGLGAHPLYPR